MVECACTSGTCGHSLLHCSSTISCNLPAAGSQDGRCNSDHIMLQCMSACHATHLSFVYAKDSRSCLTMQETYQWSHLHCGIDRYRQGDSNCHVCRSYDRLFCRLTDGTRGQTRVNVFAIGLIRVPMQRTGSVSLCEPSRFLPQ